MSPHIHIALGLNHLVLAAAKAAAPAKTGSATGTIVFVLVIGAIAYFLLIRPQRNRARKAQQVQASMSIGDEVMLTSGIIGRITWLEGDRARVEIAPNTEIEVVKQALGRKVTAPVPDVATDAGDEESETGGDGVQLPYAVGTNHAAEETASPVGDGAVSPVAADSEDREGT